MGTSLNDYLDMGPSLNPLLYSIMLRFRENRVTLVGDIENAFLNVEVNEGDRDYLRFLWVNNIESEKAETIVYWFCRVVFGLKLPPSLLNATMRHRVSKYLEVVPEFMKKILEIFYVDDLVSGERAEQGAYELYEKAKSRMSQGGFRLRKWLTNAKC